MLGVLLVDLEDEGDMFLRNSGWLTAGLRENTTLQNHRYENRRLYKYFFVSPPKYAPPPLLTTVTTRSHRANRFLRSSRVTRVIQSTHRNVNWNQFKILAIWTPHGVNNRLSPKQ
jgi:hypothetical protein